MDINQMAGGMPQQMPQRNPLAPASAPTVQDQLQAYRQTIALAMGNTQQAQQMPATDTNPNAAFADSGMEDPSNVEELKTQQVNNAAFASQSPVNTQQMPQTDPKKAEAIQAHLDSSEAFKEMFGHPDNPDDMGPLGQILQHLHLAYKNGEIDFPTAVAHLNEAGPMIEQTIMKHHGHEDHKNMTQHPDTYVEPDSVDSVMGGV